MNIYIFHPEFVSCHPEPVEWISFLFAWIRQAHHDIAESILSSMYKTVCGLINNMKNNKVLMNENLIGVNRCPFHPAPCAQRLRMVIFERQNHE